jgi:hypothetical protein
MPRIKKIRLSVSLTEANIQETVSFLEAVVHL